TGVSRDAAAWSKPGRAFRQEIRGDRASFIDPARTVGRARNRLRGIRRGPEAHRASAETETAQFEKSHAQQRCGKAQKKLGERFVRCRAGAPDPADRTLRIARPANGRPRRRAQRSTVSLTVLYERSSRRAAVRLTALRRRTAD